MFSEIFLSWIMSPVTMVLVDFSHMDLVGRLQVLQLVSMPLLALTALQQQVCQIPLFYVAGNCWRGVGEEFYSFIFQNPWMFLHF